ncbi:MAG: signal recognition particle-docking protein FtsY [Phycisphaerales bacterium]|nr:signal recognition particle-docking protein FtsY [Phycisphaerales bacterium]
MGLLRGTFGLIRSGLGHTRRLLGGELVDRLRGRVLDAHLLDDIEAHLIRSDVGVDAATDIIKALRDDVAKGALSKGEDAIDFLKKQMASRLAGQETGIAQAESGPTVVLVAGVNGVGKTTSIAKLAHAFQAQGQHVLLAAGDTFRAAAAEQLETWGQRIGVDVIRGHDGADPASVVFDAIAAAVAREADVLIVDTAGRMHTEDGLMRQLSKIRGVLEKKIPGAPHEVLLVLDATQGQNALVQARSFQDVIDATGIVLSKLDGTARGGIVLAIRDQLGIPVKFVGHGERLEDLATFEPDLFVDAMFADSE